MFNSVHILILGQRDEEIRAIEDLAHGLNFSTRTTEAIHEAIECTPTTDILIAVEQVPTGPTQPAIQQFLKGCDGPLLVITNNFADDEVMYRWLKAGAWNAWRRPIDPAAIQTTLTRYGRVVLEARERESLKAEVASLKKWLIRLIIGVAGIQLLAPVLGDQIVNFFTSLF